MLVLILFLNTNVKAKEFKPIKIHIIRYNVQTAKEEAFRKVPLSLPLSYFQADLTDKYHQSNMNYLKNTNNQINKKEPQRSIFPSFLGQTLVSYGIRYNNRMNKVYHYNSLGNLLRIEFDDNNPDKYPKRITTYNNKGKLHTVVFYVSDKEQFNFDGNGNLIVHWIGEKAYNKNGSLMRIRRSL